MSESPAGNSPVLDALKMMVRISRYHGSAVLIDGEVAFDVCPEGTNLDLFSEAVEGFFQDWKDAEEVLIRFDEINLILVHRKPVTLCLFLPLSIEVGGAYSLAGRFFDQFGPLIGAKSSIEKLVEDEESEGRKLYSYGWRP